MNVHKPILDEIINNNLLFDELDIIKGIELFKQKFHNFDKETYITFINSHFLNNTKTFLKLKLHQALTIENFKINENEKLHLLSHKPRSGKSITMLSICKYLLEKGNKKILIMTAITQTIDNFKNDLEKYIDFQNIKFILQKDIKNLDENFEGIVFCSIQYLKTQPNKKRKFLIDSNFKVMFMDECHQGGNTEKTENDILNIESLNDIEKIRKKINLNIFSSGTSKKTKDYYKIKNIYEWTQHDEGIMKQLLNEQKPENIETLINIMKNRHGEKFKEIYENENFTKDYNNMPTQVLIS
jgi:hypothetical protein